MRRAITALLLALAVTGATACSQEEASVVERAVNEPVTSAEVSLDLAAGLGREKFRSTVTGPFQLNGDAKLPSFDFRVRFSVTGEKPETVRVVSTGDTFAFRYGGQTIALPKAEVAAFNREIARERRRSQGLDDLEDLKRLGANLLSWFPESATDPDGQLDGVVTRRIRGRLDVSTALTDVARLLKTPAVRRQLKAQDLDDLELTRRDIRAIDNQTNDPRLAIQVGRDDGKLRELVATVAFREGRKKGDARLRLALTRVDQPVRIEPLKASRPLRALDLLGR